MVKMDPSPRSETTLMDPLCKSKIRLTMGNPSPQPLIWPVK